MQHTRHSSRFPSVFLIVGIALAAFVPAVRVSSKEKRHTPQRVALVAPGSESNVAVQFVIDSGSTPEPRALIAPDSSQPDPQVPLAPTGKLGEIDVVHVGRVISATPVAEKGKSASSRGLRQLPLGAPCDCDEDCHALGDQCNIVQCAVRSFCTLDPSVPCATDQDCDRVGAGTCTDEIPGCAANIPPNCNFVQRCALVQLIDWPCDDDANFCTLDRCEDDASGLGTSVCAAQDDGAGGTLSACAKQCVGGPANGLRCTQASDCAQGSCEITPGGGCDSAAEACFAGPSLATAIGRCCDAGACTETDEATCTGGGGLWYRYRDPEDMVGNGVCVCPKYSSGVAPPGVDQGSIDVVRPSGLMCDRGSRRMSGIVYCEDPNGTGLSPSFCQNRCVGAPNDGEICTTAADCLPGSCDDDPCVPNDIEGGCLGGFLSIGDDFSMSNGSFQRLTQFRFRGGVTNVGEDIVIEFWDPTGTQLIDAFAVNDLGLTGTYDWTIEVDCWPNCDPNQLEVPLQRPIIIPPNGWVVMRSKRTIGTIDGAAAFWSQTDSPSDVGLNDDMRMWIDGDTNASMGTNVMIFELVGTKVPDPLGACCDDAVTCDDTLRWECGICSETSPAVLCAGTLHDCPIGGLGGSVCQFNRWFGPISHTDFEFGGADLTLCNGISPCDSGACCDGNSCTVMTESACIAAGGDFQGIATDCTPNCCPVSNPTGSDCVCTTLTCVPTGVTQLRHPYECHDDFSSPLLPPVQCDPNNGDLDCTVLDPLFTCGQSFTTSVTVTTTDTINSSFGLLAGDACSLNNNVDPVGWYELIHLPDPTPGDGWDDCYVLTVGLCCTDPVLTPVWPFLSSFINCPCAVSADVMAHAPDFDISGDPLDGFGANSKAGIAGRCEDGNYSATFTVPPGEYAYQINAGTSCAGSAIPCDTDNDCPGTSCVAPNPDYTVHFTVESCNLGACCINNTCTVTNELDCAAQDGNFLGDAEQPIVSCFGGPCSLGSCCVDGTCNDDMFHDELAECTVQGGVYLGGVVCDSRPCSACPFDSPQNCQQVQTIFGLVPLMDRNPENGSSNGTFAMVLADDVKFGGSQVDEICWNTGFFATPCCGESCTQNTDDTWEIRIYEENPICNAFPGPQLSISTITVLNKVEGTGQGTGTWHYSGSLNTPIGLPNGGFAGETYWFEVSAFGEPGCEVRATWSRDDGNGHFVSSIIHPVTGSRGFYRAVAGDVGFCEDSGVLRRGRDVSGILNPGEVLGACCTSPATCQDNFTQRDCNEIQGVWMACADCGETPCPAGGAPPNDDATSATIINGVPDPDDRAELLVAGENIFATDDGPPLSGRPDAGNCGPSLVYHGDMHNDVWYSYVAEDCGVLTVSACEDADFDLMIAVYPPPAGPAPTKEDQISCEDDNCGLDAGPASISIPVLQGEELLVRVGGWNDEIPGGYHGQPRGRFVLHWTLDRNCATLESPTLAPAPHNILKNRYISIDPRGATGVNVGFPFDIQVTLTTSQVNGVTAVGNSWWATRPDADCISTVGPTRPSTPVNWDACPTVHLTGCPIIPTSVYGIVAVAGATISDPPLSAQTQAKPGAVWWGDCVGGYDGSEWTPPNGVVNIEDVMAVVVAFLEPGAVTAPHVSLVDLHPNLPPLQINKLVNINDMIQAIDAFGGLEYPGYEIELCGDPVVLTCSTPADCADDLYCNGDEDCVDGLCVADTDRCPGTFCDEDADECITCLVNADCDDGLFCNGLETCMPPNCIHCIGTEPCLAEQVCDESVDQCVGALYAWVPIGATGSHTIDGNSIFLDGVGQTVALDIRVSNWGTVPGAPELRAYQATVDSSGYASGDGDPLVPSDAVITPSSQICSISGRRCDPPYQPCDSPAEGTCIGNWVFEGFDDPLYLVATADPDYAWGAIPQEIGGQVDGGIAYHAGTLELDVPAGALGTYTIDFLPGESSTFLTDAQGLPIEGVSLQPAKITINSDIKTKDRYLTFRPDQSGSTAYRLDMVSSLFHPTAVVSGWVGSPDANGIASLETGIVSRVWTEPEVHITGCEIAPAAVFELRASTDNGKTFLPPLIIRTTPRPRKCKFWGDVVGSKAPPELVWTSPQGVTNFDDIVAAIETFQAGSVGDMVPRTDVVPQEPNRLVSFADVQWLIFAFKGDGWAFGCPDDPCQDNMLNPCQ